ncbi:MAG: hypothetical protein WC959_06145 [Kiritimatiellales bacterium]
MTPMLQISTTPIFHLPLAAMEDFIWIVIALLWGVVQLAAGAAKKKRQENQSARSTPQSAPEKQADPFAEMLKKLAGITDLEEVDSDDEEIESGSYAPPEYKPAPETVKSAFVSKSPWTSGDIKKLPDIKPLLREIPKPAPMPAPVEIPKIDVHPTMSQFRSSIPAIKLPAMNLCFLNGNSAGGKSSAGKKLISSSDRPALRRAMLSHIIFSKPKALE